MFTKALSFSCKVFYKGIWADEWYIIAPHGKMSLILSYSPVDGVDDDVNHAQLVNVPIKEHLSSYNEVFDYFDTDGLVQDFIDSGDVDKLVIYTPRHRR